MSEGSSSKHRVLNSVHSHVSAGFEQELEVLLTTSTDIKAVVQSNEIEIRELIRTKKESKQNILPLQKQAEKTVINVETLHHEVRHSRQDVLSLRENVLEEFTALAERANDSQRSIEATIERNLARYGVELNELRQEMKHAFLKQSLEVNQQTVRMENLVRIAFCFTTVCSPFISERISRAYNWVSCVSQLLCDQSAMRIIALSFRHQIRCHCTPGSDCRIKVDVDMQDATANQSTLTQHPKLVQQALILELRPTLGGN